MNFRTRKYEKQLKISEKMNVVENNTVISYLEKEKNNKKGPARKMEMTFFLFIHIKKPQS